MKTQKITVPLDGSGSTLYLQNGILSNREFAVDVSWLESLAGNKAAASLLKALSKTQVRDVTAMLQGQQVVTAKKPLEQIVSDVKLKFFQPVDVSKAFPVIEFDGHDSNGNLPWTESIQSFAFRVKGHTALIEVSKKYFGLLTLDPDAKVLAKRFDRPIAVVKNDKTVALVMPETSMRHTKLIKEMENKNGKK